VKNPLHIDLVVIGGGPGATQPVEVEPLGNGEYRILYSPGLVEGIAAGDVIHVTDPGLGLFDVLVRGGNVAVKLGAPEPLEPSLAAVCADVEALGGRLDGAIERAAVWTIPVSAGFAQIEKAMAAAVARIPGAEWWYGNVYDDEGKPLGWWMGRR
jgi:uncharacterized protein DUF4265